MHGECAWDPPRLGLRCSGVMGRDEGPPTASPHPRATIEIDLQRTRVLQPV